ncbi:MAG: PA0069 family radical SAM protein [bacterium]
MQVVQNTNSHPLFKGRGTTLNPENRFEHLKLEIEPEWLELEPNLRIKTEYFVDSSQAILAKNESPDVGFNYSLNPYRGCEHGCVYCYARPTHEFFGLSAGLDFETKIMVKQDAAELLDKAFRSSNWQPQVVAVSGNTDCYQPIEKHLRITRNCLQVFLKFRNPLALITKNVLILRDLDILQELAKFNLVRVTLSITTLDRTLARIMEPRTSAPEKRLEAVEQLASAGIPTYVNIAPLIPALNEHEISAILKEAAARGAVGAAYILLRLPHSVKELFSAWLQQHFPDRAAKVLHAIRETRDGKLSDPRFGTRITGEGIRAQAIARMFELSCMRFGLTPHKYELATEHFRRGKVEQRELFLRPENEVIKPPEDSKPSGGFYSP